MGALGTDESGVGRDAIRWDLVFVDEEYGVGAFDVVANALGKSPEFVGRRCEPCVARDRVCDELLVFHGVPSGWMQYGVDGRENVVQKTRFFWIL